MDLIIFMIVSMFGLVFTFVGFRFVEFSLFSMLINISSVALLGSEGLTQVIGYNSTNNITQTFDVGLLILVPLFIAILNFFAILKYVRDR